jgi:hypothetical protein
MIDEGNGHSLLCSEQLEGEISGFLFAVVHAVDYQALL